MILSSQNNKLLENKINAHLFIQSILIVVSGHIKLYCSITYNEITFSKPTD